MSESQSLERNLDIARTTAEYLNSLVDQGVLSNKDVSSANDDAIIEMMDRVQKGRYPKNSQDFSFSTHLNDKIRTLFASEKTESNKLPSRESVITFGRELLNYLQNHGFSEVEGILLFGSYLDPNKKTRIDSDVDALLFLKIPTPLLVGENVALMKDQEIGDDIKDPTSPYLEMDIVARNFARKYDYTDFIDIQLSIAGLSNREQFDWELNFEEERLPFWALKPQAIYFIGSLGNQSEEMINKKIHKNLNSTYARKIKEKLIREIKLEFLNFMNS